MNAIASLGAQAVVAREQVQRLTGKRWSKQFQAQRDADLKALASFEASLPVIEGTRYGLMFLERELYG